MSWSRGGRSVWRDSVNSASGARRWVVGAIPKMRWGVNLRAYRLAWMHDEKWVVDDCLDWPDFTDRDRVRRIVVIGLGFYSWHRIISVSGWIRPKDLPRAVTIHRLDGSRTVTDVAAVATD